MPLTDYSAVIGLEIHVQLDTKSKMFCRCDNNADGAAPNERTCEVCMGLPGTLPVPNRTAVEWAIKTAMALGCEITQESKFDRKQYYYPDLPKGYQISQYDQPFGGPGAYEFDREDGNEATKFSFGITRLHLEEDAGKLTHPAGKPYSLVDLNRAGTPLMEIVTDAVVVPNPQEAPELARKFLQELRLLMRHLGVSRADMEKGHLRCDANISINKPGTDFGAKVEIKNMNSFKFVEKGIRGEIDRQFAALEAGETIVQETRGFDAATGQTTSQRSKEAANDYRYFPEPDIPPFAVADLKIVADHDETTMPVRMKRKWRKHNFNEGTQNRILESGDRVAAFDTAIESSKGSPIRFSHLWAEFNHLIEKPKEATLFILEIARAFEDYRMNPGIGYGDQKYDIEDAASKFKQQQKPFGEIFGWEKPQQVDLAPVVTQAITENPDAVADYRSGNENAKNRIVGTVMKETKGSADPAAVQAEIAKQLDS